MTPSVVVETNSTKSVAGSLAAKIQSAYLWTGAFQIGKSLLGFVISILLARRLQPSDYGLVGMVTVLIAIVSVFQDWGIGQAVIYFKEDSEEDLATYFTVTTATGVVLTVALFLCGSLHRRQFLSRTAFDGYRSCAELNVPVGRPVVGF